MSAEPPVEAIPQYIDDTGTYFWNADKGNYWNSTKGKEYTVTPESKSVGNATYIFNGEQGIQGGFTLTPDRPDYDGKLTLSEANKWYQTGGGKPLFVDAAKIDLSPVEKSDFNKVGGSFYKNFAFTTNTETGLVYGNIKLTLLNDKGTVKLGGAGGLLDKYNFDYKGGVKNLPRDMATWFGEQKAGKGSGYSIFNYGTGTIK